MRQPWLRAASALVRRDAATIGSAARCPSTRAALSSRTGWPTAGGDDAGRAGGLGDADDRARRCPDPARRRDDDHSGGPASKQRPFHRRRSASATMPLGGTGLTRP
jgi:hypothetical protein